MNKNNLLIDFIIEFESSSSLNDCFKVLEKCVEGLGFTGLVYSLIPLHHLANNDPVFLASSNFSANFLEQYAYENFATHDYTIKRIITGDLTPTDWWAEEEQGKLLTQEKHVIQVAKSDYHIFNGISIPTLSAAHQIAGASIISQDNNLSFATLLEERLLILRAIINLFHYRVCSNLEFTKNFYFPLLTKLTELEKKVLQFTVSGRSYKSIDANDGISANSASNVRSDLFKKFKVKNVNELAYIAGLHRLIEML